MIHSPGGVQFWAVGIAAGRADRILSLSGTSFFTAEERNRSRSIKMEQEGPWSSADTPVTPIVTGGSTNIHHKMAEGP